MPAWLRWQALSTNPAQLREHTLAARSLVRAAHALMRLAATGALMGSHVAPYWDPIFAIALSFWVVWAWGGQARVHILNLVGLSAPPALLQAGHRCQPPGPARGAAAAAAPAAHSQSPHQTRSSSSLKVAAGELSKCSPFFPPAAEAHLPLAAARPAGGGHRHSAVSSPWGPLPASQKLRRRRLPGLAPAWATNLYSW